MVGAQQVREQRRQGEGRAGEKREGRREELSGNDAFVGK